MSKLLSKEPYLQHQITKYDIKQEISDLGYLNFSDFDVIIGATGNKMMDHRYFDSLKPNTVLLSVSSSDREFDACHFRKLSGKKYNVHDDVFYKNCRLINCGFPINFNGQKSTSVPLDKIQLVCALLLLGVCSYNSCDALNKQFVPINSNYAGAILKHYNAEYV